MSLIIDVLGWISFITLAVVLFFVVIVLAFGQHLGE